jgi:hypothetical protein
MRTSAAVVVAVVAVVLGFMAGPASAKGASGGTLDGEGMETPIAVPADLTDDTGLYEQIWEASPSRAVDAAPTDDLGPRLRITWSLMGPNGEVPVVQELYPYAEGGPVTFVAAGQPMWEGARTNGGWFRAPARLITTLADLGVPARSALEPASTGGGSTTTTTWAPIGASVVVVLGLGAALALLTRRRGEAAPAAG